MDMTLKEVCAFANVSRRAIQGYEKAELVHATGKNKYGYLLYDETMQKRMKTIRLYQNLGFSIKEIQQIVDAPNEVVKSAIKEKIKKLYQKRETITRLIHIANEIICKL